MEYQLLKTIEPSLAIFQNNPAHPILSPYPAFDFVNPGLGQISRIFSFYVPLHASSNLHGLKKKVAISQADNLEGFGEVVENSDVVEDESNLIKKQLESDPIEFNEAKRQRLGSGIHDSFLNPKVIKTGKIVFTKNTPESNEKQNEISSKKKDQKKERVQTQNSKITKHKFQFA